MDKLIYSMGSPYVYYTLILAMIYCLIRFFMLFKKYDAVIKNDYWFGAAFVLMEITGANYEGIIHLSIKLLSIAVLATIGYEMFRRVKERDSDKLPLIRRKLKLIVIESVLVFIVLIVTLNAMMGE